MKAKAILACVLVGLGLVASDAAAAKRVRQWYQKVDQPLKMFHWQGPGTGSDKCSRRMAGAKTDTVIAPAEPTLADLHNLRSADVVSIRNHGGCLQTYGPGELWKDRTYLLGRSPQATGTPARSINLPTDDDRGPSVVLAWGCHNATSDRHGQRFPNALGVKCDSKAKAYVAPKYDVQAQGDKATFQCVFFEQLAKGDVSVEEAARQAYKDMVAASYSPSAYGSFESAIDICGNKDLTLDDVRENVSKRNKAAASPPPPPPGTGKPERYVSTSSHNNGAYCTNNPKIQSNLPVSPVITKTRPPTRPAGSASPKPSVRPSAKPSAKPPTGSSPRPPVRPTNAPSAAANPPRPPPPSRPAPSPSAAMNDDQRRSAANRIITRMVESGCSPDAIAIQKKTNFSAFGFEGDFDDAPASAPGEGHAGTPPRPPREPVTGGATTPPPVATRPAVPTPAASAAPGPSPHERAADRIITRMHDSGCDPAAIAAQRQANQRAFGHEGQYKPEEY